MLGATAKAALGKYKGMRPEEVAERERIDVLEVAGMPGRFADVFIFSTIFLPTGLPRSQWRWRIAHCLGHWFLHEGNQIWCHDNHCLFRPKQEGQAEAFAACLLTGMDDNRGWTPDELQAVKAGRWQEY